jgi:hypothetical protein
MRSMSIPSTLFRETRIIIPVRNGGACWHEAAAALRAAIPDPSTMLSCGGAGAAFARLFGSPRVEAIL